MLSSSGVVLICVLLPWVMVYILNRLLKLSSLKVQYERFLHVWGISLSTGNLKLFCTCLNRVFARCSKAYPKWQKRWFSFGAIFGLTAMILSMLVLLYRIVLTFDNMSSYTSYVGHAKLVMVLPGINMPYSHAVYMFLAVLLSAFLHEAGHAVCALVEGVTLNGFGLFLMVVYPGAYVDLDTETLLSKTHFQQLRIYCAGIWHNFVLLVAAYLLLLSLPYILSPLYQAGKGVVVLKVDPQSPLFSPTSFPVGTVITDINRCPVINSATYADCLNNILRQKPNGFCIDVNTLDYFSSVHQLESFSRSVKPVECCSVDSLGDLCFQFDQTKIPTAQDILFGRHKEETRDYSDANARRKRSTTMEYRCLRARKIVNNFECDNEQECDLFYGATSTCIFPSQANKSRLLRVTHSSGEDLLYIGDPLVFSFSITVGDFVPSFAFLPNFLPDIISTFCQYLISFSAALALLNAVPSYGLDGQWIFSALVDIIGHWVRLKHKHKEEIKFFALTVGTSILAVNIIIAFSNAFQSF